MAKSIDLNQEIVISFEIIPSQKVYHPIASLIDREFNPEGLGRVDITEEGLEITVHNAETKATARLLWKSSRLINFHCTKPIVGKIICVRPIHGVVSDAISAHHKTITILHLDGSNELTFILGDSEINVAFTEIDTQFERVPSIKIFCETVFPCLWQIIHDKSEKVEASKLVLVSVNLPKTFVSARTAKSKWMRENPRVCRMAAEKIHHVWFHMRYLAVIRSALYVQDSCHICFLTEPAARVMIRFSIQELGDFAFIFKALYSIGYLDKVLNCADGKPIPGLSIGHS